MTLIPDIQAKILRYYHVEKWRIGTIARHLHVHHGAVDRMLRQAGVPRAGTLRRSRIDPYRHKEAQERAEAKTKKRKVARSQS